MEQSCWLPLLLPSLDGGASHATPCTSVLSDSSSIATQSTRSSFRERWCTVQVCVEGKVCLARLTIHKILAVLHGLPSRTQITQRGAQRG